MTSGKSKSAADSGVAAQLSLQRIRVKADGYDQTGAYWGAGADVYIATTVDGATEITVRAKTIAEAREKAAAEFARPPGEPRTTSRNHIGGAAPTKSRFEIDWRDPETTKTVRIRVTHSRDYLGQGQDHIEVESLAPATAALPITETGYRSHFMSPLELINEGGPITFVTAWLDREAKGKDWQKKVARRQQGDLFQWAEAQTVVTAREGTKRKAVETKQPTSKPQREAQRRPKPS
jgi:hypothetical protein